MFLFLSFLLLSCDQDQKKEPTPKPVNLAEIPFDTPRLTLVGNAASVTSSWEEYTAFQTAFENYDHSLEATGRLALAVKNMRDNLRPEFENQPIRSRLLVLESRVKSYESFLQYTTKTADQYEDYFNAIVTAQDNLTAQLNEKFEFERIEQELIEELKTDLRDLNAVPSDSLR
ncbi:hypothetical protein NMS_0465 [Nonlabens marinus S1-08]|uniref:Uncharacterized protein n=1 Tax=Nonlabens marinus S1-08 TaxID=1454201 RepID=W8VNH8_9FLAO|nr:hypothetical protein NMS_0465 [Nonlabens marinus S1-08]